MTTRRFAFLLLIAIVLIHILTYVDGRGFRSFRMRKPVHRTVHRPPVRRPVYRPPVRRPVYRPPTHTTTTYHHPSKSGASNKFIHAEGGGRPKQTTSNHVPATPPKVPPRPATVGKPTVTLPKVSPRPSAPAINSHQQHVPSKPLTSDVAKPYKPSASTQAHAVQPHSSSAGSSSSHSANSVSKPQTVSKPNVPLKDPSSSGTAYKPLQTSQVKPSEGSSSIKASDHGKPTITAKPSAPLEPVKKVTSTNVQSASKPHVTHPGSNYPAWANPDLKPGSKPLPSPSGSSGSSSGTPISNPSLPKPYKPESSQVKPNYGTSSSSTKPVVSGSKPLTGPVPQKPYHASSQASSSSSKPTKTNDAKQTQGTSASNSGGSSKPSLEPSASKPSTSSSSLNKPSTTNQAKPNQGSAASTTNGHPNNKPLPETPASTTNGHPNNKPLPESPATASHQATSNSAAQTHHEMPSAPITPGSQAHSGYPGAVSNYPTGGSHYPPPPHHGYPMHPYGDGGGGSGMGRLFKESLVSSLVNEGVHRMIHGPQNPHGNFDYRPLNPEIYQPPPYRPSGGDTEISAPISGHTTINNHYYFDPNATVTNSAQPINQQPNNSAQPINQQPNNSPTIVQTSESASPSANVVSNNDAASTGTQGSSNNKVDTVKKTTVAPINKNSSESSDDESEDLSSINQNSTESADPESEDLPPPVEPTIVEIVPIDNDELWNLTESMFANEDDIGRYIVLNLQNSETDSVDPVVATEPLIFVQKEANLLPTIKAFRDLLDNYEIEAGKAETTNSDKDKEESAMLDAFLKTEAMIKAMQLLTDKGYVKSGQWKETLQHLWLRRYNDTMSGFERIFLAEKYPGAAIFGGQNWIYFDHQEQSKHIKYMNYRNSLDLGDNAQLLKVSYQFDNEMQIDKSMLVGTSPHLEMALYTVCHFVKPNDWCTVSLGNTKFGIFTHAFVHLEKPMLDLGRLDF